MKTSVKASTLGYVGWCGLGVLRGIQSYKYETVKNDKEYFYSSCILHGFIGVIVYGNPVALPYTAYKEIYRLEVNLRNIENEKKTTFYNAVL